MLMITRWLLLLGPLGYLFSQQKCITREGMSAGFSQGCKTAGYSDFWLLCTCWRNHEQECRIADLQYDAATAALRTSSYHLIEQTFLLFLSRGAASLAPELVLHFYCFCDVGLDLRPNSWWDFAETTGSRTATGMPGTGVAYRRLLVHRTVGDWSSEIL